MTVLTLYFSARYDCLVKMARVAIYCRVSTTDQDTGLQLREIKEYLSARGLGEAILFEDQATGTNGNRHKLKELLKAARGRKIDVVICWRLDRLFRSLKDLIATLQEFTELGIAFISLRDQIDLSTSSGRLMMHMIGAFAEFEASLIRERVRAGLANAKAKGVKLGRPKVRKDADILRLRADGISIREIGRVLGVSKGAVQRAIVAGVPKPPQFTGTSPRA